MIIWWVLGLEKVECGTMEAVCVGGWVQWLEVECGEEGDKFEELVFIGPDDGKEGDKLRLSFSSCVWEETSDENIGQHWDKVCIGKDNEHSEVEICGEEDWFVRNRLE